MLCQSSPESARTEGRQGGVVPATRTLQSSQQGGTETAPGEKEKEGGLPQSFDEAQGKLLRLASSLAGSTFPPPPKVKSWEPTEAFCWRVVCPDTHTCRCDLKGSAGRSAWGAASPGAAWKERVGTSGNPMGVGSPFPLAASCALGIGRALGWGRGGSFPPPGNDPGLLRPDLLPVVGRLWRRRESISGTAAVQPRPLRKKGDSLGRQGDFF